jgi:hypothetical protein
LAPRRCRAYDLPQLGRVAQKNCSREKTRKTEKENAKTAKALVASSAMKAFRAKRQNQCSFRVS